MKCHKSNGGPRRGPMPARSGLTMPPGGGRNRRHPNLGGLGLACLEDKLDCLEAKSPRTIKTGAM